MNDTDTASRARLHELLRAAPPAERLTRALALTAVARELAWQGATRHAGHLGAAAVVDRFLRQLYGPEVAAQVAAQRTVPPRRA